ncbi:EFR1 family ferrodoxin [Culicoidibacter larvae]|uniref:4Fe-4S dicluster domain-containing protein n=1 Tax=Culicoidibacter larvae TaxID=2579976 RepID=A0A5R8QCF7_9FIRM|nr:EFR1 family ferrodoxin [Culicoidibacter larvae]TLG74188.1 4Fe-4S dicluster domain-containing protein [Culicoidibacter larvae]
MNILHIYHSGVGNTRLVAEQLHHYINQVCPSQLFTVENASAEAVTNSQYLILGFPTYHCQPSDSIMKFIEALPEYPEPKYAFIYTSCGLYPANTLRIFAQLCARKNIRVVYDSWYRAPATDGVLLTPGVKLFKQFPKDMTVRLQIDAKQFITRIQNTELLSYIPRFKLYGILNYPNRYFALKHKHTIYIDDSSCIACGKCICNCPQHALSFDEEKHVQFSPKPCESCLRCVHHCPVAAMSIRKNHKPKQLFDTHFYDVIQASWLNK